MKPRLDLRREYLRATRTPSDIYRHLPVLYRLARRCRHVTELGSRTGASTRAFLFARPARFVAYDRQFLEPEPQDAEGVATLVELLDACRAHGMDCEYHGQDVLEVEIEETDLLFIDTLHTYAQLKRELELHARKARRFIAFHDTGTFGEVGEEPGTLGIRPAILEFLARSPEWTIRHESQENNGLIIIARKARPSRPRTVDAHAVLERAPRIALRVLGTGQVQVRVEGGVLTFGRHALAALDLFSTPRSIAEASERLRSRMASPHDWVELIATIQALRSAGLLREPGRRDRRRARRRLEPST